MEVDGHTFWLMEHDTFGDEAPCVIVDEKGKLAISDVYDGFDEHTVHLLEMEVLPVDRMPDETISVDEMKEYGYAWGGNINIIRSSKLPDKLLFVCLLCKQSLFYSFLLLFNKI